MDFITLTSDDEVTETTKVTTGYFTGDLGSLAGSNFSTESLAAGEKKYYYDLQYSSEDQFSVAFGHINGLGSQSGSTANKVGQTEAVYRQFASQLLLPSEISGGFIINSTSQSACHFIVAKRARMKDRINKKNWTLQLSGSTSAHPTSASVLHLTDDSDVSGSEATPVGPRFNIVSGSTGTILAASSSKHYGHFYPNMGILVLSTTQLSSSIPGHDVVTNNITLATMASGSGFTIDTSTDAQNALKMVKAMQLGTQTFRSEEDQTSKMYFCRAKAGNFNYTNNPTFTSGSDNGFSQLSMEGNPQTFITTIGLYDASDALVAVGKLSTPVQKNRSSEAVIKAKLTF